VYLLQSDAFAYVHGRVFSKSVDAIFTSEYGRRLHQSAQYSYFSIYSAHIKRRLGLFGSSFPTFHCLHLGAARPRESALLHNLILGFR
jgi:hypothetical protein